MRSSIEDWLQEFNTYCSLEGMNAYYDLKDIEDNLFMYLCPDARNFYSTDLKMDPLPAFHSWHDIEERLIRLFSVATPLGNIPFHNRMQFQYESLQEYMSTLLTLAKSAFPSIPESARHALVIEKFVYGVYSENVNNALRHEPIKSLAEALHVAKKAESGDLMRQHSFMSRAIHQQPYHHQAAPSYTQAAPSYTQAAPSYQSAPPPVHNQYSNQQYSSIQPTYQSLYAAPPPPQPYQMYDPTQYSGSGHNYTAPQAASRPPTPPLLSNQQQQHFQPAPSAPPLPHTESKK